MKPASFDDMLNLIYDAATHPETWSRALDAVAKQLGVPCATIIPLTQSFSLLASPGVEEAQRVYAESWWQQDIMVGDMKRKGFPLGLYKDWEQIAPERIARDAYYQEFRTRFDLGYMMCNVTKPFPGEAYAIGIQLSASQGPLGSQGVERFQSLARHLNRALTMSCQLKTAETRGRSLEGALEALDQGAAIVEPDGRVMFANEALRGMKSRGIAVETNGLRCLRGADQAGLDRMIAGCTSMLGAADVADYVTIGTQGGQLPLLVRALPLRRVPGRGELFVPWRSGQVLVLVFDLDRKSQVDTQKALLALGLTQREASVAALVGSGLSPYAAADRLGIARDTVRANLKRIYDKLSLGRAAQLVAIVERIRRL